MNPELPSDLASVLAALDDTDDLSRLLRDLLTPAEIEAIGERWNIVKRLASGASQRTVRDILGVSIGTVSRGARQLRYGEGGFNVAFDTLQTLNLEDPRTEADTQ